MFSVQQRAVVANKTLTAGNNGWLNFITRFAWTKTASLKKELSLCKQPCAVTIDFTKRWQRVVREEETACNIRIGNSLAGSCINRLLFAIQLSLWLNVLCGSFFHTFNFKFITQQLYGREEHGIPNHRQYVTVSSNLRIKHVDIETAKYIINYFSNLLTGAERMAIKHTSSIYKLENSTLDNSNLTRIYQEKGWLTSDQNVLDLLKDGYETFQLNIANRILNQYKEEVFFNNCPKCHKLARTPYARQCRHCGHSWHNLTVAEKQ